MTPLSLPLTLAVDETVLLPQVATPAEVRDRDGGCFCELLPHVLLKASELFPGHVAIRTGEREKPDWWLDEDSNVAALHLFKVRDAFLFPAFGVVITQDGSALRLPMSDAAYFSPDLTALPHVEARDGRIVLDVPDGVPRLERSALTMALGAKGNYGHFLLDCLPASASIRGTGCLETFPFHFPPLAPWQRRHLELLGIEPGVLDGDIYRIGEVVYTTGMHHYLHTPNFNYLEVRDRQLAALGGAAGKGARRLYLSRARYRNRVMASEAALERRLSRLGFETVDPGSLSVDAQIALFRDAEVVVGSAGAAFANVLYCRAGTLIVEIQPAGMENQWVRNICLQNGCRFVAYFCDSTSADPTKPEIDMRFDLDVGRFIGTISDFAPLDAPGRAGLFAGWRRRLGL